MNQVMPTKLLQAILIFACIVFSGFAKAQTLRDTLNRKFSVEHLREDFKVLRNKLESSQPGLYLYTPKDSLDAIFDNIEASLTEPLTSIEFFRKIAPLNKFLRNLHTRLWPSTAYEKAMETEMPRFPIDIHWRDGRIYVLRNHSNDERIPEGTIITSINGESAEAVFTKLLDCRVRDGFNESYAIAQASRNFSFYYAQLIGTPEIFVLELISEAGANLTVEINAVKASQIHESRASKYKRKYSQYSEDWDTWIAAKEPALRFEQKDEMAILTVKTFYLPIIEQNGQNYEEFFKRSFDQLINSNTKHLVIDLRNNHGGTDPVAMSLMSHLHDSIFYYYKRRTSIIKPDKHANAVKKGDVYEFIGRGEWRGKVIPAKAVYKGKVYVLMNGYSVSAAGEFIGHLKNIDRAIFIGEEAGGNPVMFTGGGSLPVDLNHTRITGAIPLQLVEMNVSLKNTGHGVMPDYEIRPTIVDILQGSDVELDYALELIQNEVKKSK
jgi:C-terminal processing protease CtpA/Prc